MSFPFWSAVKGVGWFFYLAGALLILANSIADFGPGGEGLFIGQKGAIGHNPVWLLCLRLHVAAGLVCLLSCLPQFSRALLRRVPSLHRRCGKIYAASVLFLLCPTGIYLALSAKGGLAGRTGFLLLGAATFHTTFLGVAVMRGPRRDVAAHRRWTTRSFALAATAITFRIYHILFFQFGLPEDANYVVSLWLSILGNAALAELILRRPVFHSNPTSIPSTS